MIDINITVRCPDLVEAAGTLAAALGRAPQATLVQPQVAPQPQAAQTPPPANVVPMPQQPAPTPPPAAPVAPTTAPSYTPQDIARAGAMLIQANPGIQAQLQALLQQFGVQAALDLKPDQLGPFANALRGLGAKL